MTCPPGLYVPIALINNIPAFGSETLIIYNGTVEINGYEVEIDPSVTPPVNTSFNVVINSGQTLDIDNRSDIVELQCVPLSAIDSFSLA